MSTRAAASAIDAAVKTSAELGAAGLIYWQIIDNECAGDAPAGCRGFWLTKPDGGRSFDVAPSSCNVPARSVKKTAASSLVTGVLFARRASSQPRQDLPPSSLPTHLGRPSVGDRVKKQERRLVAPACCVYLT